MIVNFDPFKKLYFVSDNIELTQKSFLQFFEEASCLPRQKDVVLSSVKVSDLSLEYYDNCLVNYCKQTKDSGIRHKDTCWVRNCEDIISLGPPHFSIKNVDVLYPKSKCSGLISRFIKSHVLKKVVFDKEGWAFLRFLPPLDFTVKGLLIRARYWFFTMTGIRSRDRVLDTVDSIINQGWCNSRAILPHPTVLIYHRPTKKFSIHTGRHRIAAVRYLYDLGQVSGSLLLNVVIVSVPWGPLRTARPYPGIDKCENCQQ